MTPGEAEFHYVSLAANRPRPQAVLLNTASGDGRGLPSPETLQAVEGYNLLRTDRDAWIELEADGEQMWV